MTNFKNEALQALRGLSRNPSANLILIGVIALTVGANGLIFAFVRGVLLTPLPYSDPERIVTVWEENSQKGYLHNTVSLANFRDWRQQSRSFTALAAWRQQEGVISGQGDPERLTGAMITESFFSVLGVKPSLGRSFTAEEERERIPVALISEALWRRRFGASREVLGRNILLDGKPYVIVGVMPGGFDQPIATLFKKGDYWIPMAVPERLEGRGTRFLRVIGRVAGDPSDPDTPDTARAELAGIADQLATQYPENEGWSVSVIPLNEELVLKIRPALQVLWAAALMVLLVGCTNLANILLARVASREHEIALRLSLGATRWQLFSLLATEILILVLPGSLLGALLARVGGRYLTSNYLRFLPRLDEVDFGAPVLRFTILLTAVIVLLTAALVLVQSLRLDLGRQLVQMGRRGGASRGTRRTRDLLAVLQIILTFPLLVSTVLLMKSVQRLEDTDLGIEPRNVVACPISLPDSRYAETNAQIVFYRQLLDNLKNAPGVAARSAVSDLPLSQWDTGVEFQLAGQETGTDGKPPSAQFRIIAPGYFDTMGIPQIRGRDFDGRDREDAAGSFIISQELAQRYFGSRNPMGERLTVDYFGRQVEGGIVGVVGDVLHGGPADERRPTIYAPYPQLPARRMTVLVRSKAKPEVVTAMLRAEIRDLDRDLAVSDLMAMESLYDEAVATPRLRALVLGMLGVLALALATLGLYGVVSYSTAIRRQEIGVRMALGARRAEILLMILRQGTLLCLWGVGGGILLAVASGRFLASNLFGVNFLDLGAYAGITVLLSLIGVMASLKPASSAMNLPPAIVLKGE